MTDTSLGVGVLRTPPQFFSKENTMKQPEIVAMQRRSRVRCFYGISDAEPQQEIEKNGNRCPICRREFNTVQGTKPHIEHDHDSGWFRGVTCENCNHGLGVFHDSIESLQRAVEYLISNATPTEFNIGAAKAALRLPRNKPHGEHLEKVIASITGNKYRLGIPPPNKGKPWSEEVRKKMSTSAKKRANTDEGKKNASVAGKLGALARWHKKETLE